MTRRACRYANPLTLALLVLHLGALAAALRRHERSRSFSPRNNCSSISHWGVQTIRGGSDAKEAEGLEVELEAEEIDNKTIDQEQYNFSLYQLGDGSAQDPDGIPTRFLDTHKGDREAAKAHLQSTLQWREQHQVDTILARPHVDYDICKSITLHSFLGRDVTGHIVFFQRPALNSGQHLKLAHQNNITNQDLLMHYVYVLEYCWNILDPPIQDNNSPVMTSIVDLTGLDFGLLNKRELIAFVQQFVSMMSAHYPQRSYKTLILNAPSWFGLFYKLISPLLRESTKAKVQILTHGPNQVQVLKQVLGEQCIQYLPPELLETNKKKYKQLLQANQNQPLPTSPMELQLRNFCCQQIQVAGLEMKTQANGSSQ